MRNLKRTAIYLIAFALILLFGCSKEIKDIDKDNINEEENAYSEYIAAYTEFVAKMDNLKTNAKEKFCCVEEKITNIESGNITYISNTYNTECNLTYSSYSENTPSMSKIGGLEVVHEYGRNNEKIRTIETQFVLMMGSNGHPVAYTPSVTIDYVYSDDKCIEAETLSIDIYGKTSKGRLEYRYNKGIPGEYEVVEVGEGISRTYNADGTIKCIKMTTDRRYSETNYTYFENGELESEFSKYTNLETGIADYTSLSYVYSWDINDGKEVVYEVCEDNTRKIKLVRQYDEHGNCIIEEEYNSKGDKVSVTERIFSHKNDIIEAAAQENIEYISKCCYLVSKEKIKYKDGVYCVILEGEGFDPELSNIYAEETEARLETFYGKFLDVQVEVKGGKFLDPTKADKVSIDDYIGSWDDGSRTFMDIKMLNNDTVSIIITGSSGASESCEWEYEGRFDNNTGVISYENGKKIVYYYQSEDVAYCDGEGQLFIINGELFWKDRKGEGRNAVFKKD